jgi:hypothetical protein
MNAVLILAELEQRDVRLSARSGRLVVDAPRGVLTEQLRSRLVACKPALLLILGSDAGTVGSWARRASALLATIQGDERRADLRFTFEERAAIYEYDARLARDEAERRACAELAAKLERNG